MKTPSTYFQGLEYILIANLPFSQRIDFLCWLPKGALKTLQIDSEQPYECAPYADYEFWLDFHFPFIQSRQVDFDFEI